MQVSVLHTMLVSNGDSVNEYVDHWGAKRLTSYCIRRFRSGIIAFKDLYRRTKCEHIQYNCTALGYVFLM